MIVPVLSTPRTVAAPSVSMAVTRRVSTRSREIRQAPKGQEDRQDDRNSSGIIAIAKVIPARSASSQLSGSALDHNDQHRRVQAR